MAAVADVTLVNITINDIPVAVPKGELIVESVKRVGLEIPIFCYHPRMKPVGMCRMCLVEIGTKGPDGSVRMMPKPQAACSLPASEGLVIVTDSDKIHQDRRGVLEFLLINHPLDCPICDRGGECPLQNNTLFYGPSTSRYIEVKRHAPKAFPLSKYVTLDLERCIQCGRCVRFTEEISGDAQLGFRFRGASMQPSTFELRDFTSKFSGNVIEICPVGALTNSTYRFRARPWDLQTRPGICTNCSNGCNIHFDYRGDRLVRINGRTNEAVNEEWTCDRGKFGHDYYNSDRRLTSVLMRRGDQLVPADWASAFAEIIEKFSLGGGQVAAIGGARNSNEDLYLLRRLFVDEFKSPNLDHRLAAVSGPFAPLVQNTIADFETAKAVLVFGTSLADEEPILHLRVRKGWFQNGTKVIVAHHAETDADSFAHLILRYPAGTEAVVAGSLLRRLLDVVAAEDRATYEALTATYDDAFVETATGLSASLLDEAAAILRDGAATVTTRSLYAAAGGSDAIRCLETLAHATGGSFNNFALQANEEGATLLGILPSTGGRNTQQILEGCADGSIKSLWIVGSDPLAEFADQDLVERALENVEYLVVQDTAETAVTAYASLVLPMTAPAEMDGSYTNLERRVQRFRQVLPPKGDAKSAWRTFSELGMRIRPSTPFFQPGEVMARISAEIPAFAGCTYEGLAGEGFLLGIGPDSEVETAGLPLETSG